jgi:hypothetical protein
MSTEDLSTAVRGSGFSAGLGAAHPKRDTLPFWANLVMAHVWGAATWVRPGWAPALIACVSLLIAGLILYEDRISAAIALRADRTRA